MKLSVIVLNWNTCFLLKACLRSLNDHPSQHATECIVVDNGSVDGSPAMVRREFPAVRLVETGRNLGFAGGNNVGIRAAIGDYRLLLNSDTEITSGALDRLVGALDQDPSAGAAGAQLVYPTGALQPSGSSFITLQTLLWEQLLLDRAFPASRVFASHFLTPWHYRERKRLEVLSGACLLLRTACLEKIGLLDTGYFMYCEDVDWCRRADQAGWSRIFVPHSRVIHHHGASSATLRPEMVAIYNASRCHYFHKFEGRDAFEAARAVMIAGAMLRALAWRAKGKADTAATWRTIAHRTAAIRESDLPNSDTIERL